MLELIVIGNLIICFPRFEFCSSTPEKHIKIPFLFATYTILLTDPFQELLKFKFWFIISHFCLSYYCPIFGGHYKDIEVLEMDELYTYIKKNLEERRKRGDSHTLIPEYGQLWIGTDLKLFRLK